MYRPETTPQSKTQRNRIAAVGVSLVVLICLAGCASKENKAASTAQPQTTFASADQAVAEMVNALRANDKAALSRIFGPEADELLDSGDEVADRNRIGKFLALYDEKHQLQPEKEESVTLAVGKTDWPLPVPIVKDELGKWRFHTEAGKEEMLNRRIGQNELDVIQVCQAIVDAQKEYAERDPDGDGFPQYAMKVMSDPGKKNGLYWPTAEGEPPSPLGPLVAGAVDQGYGASGTSTPGTYHGYRYRLLKSQGPNAEGGAMDYVVNGMMIGGFGVVAYPADYGNSGIMTFITNYKGVIYQKDLGEDTEKLAKEMETFDPGSGWKMVPASDAGATAATSEASR